MRSKLKFNYGYITILFLNTNKAFNTDFNNTDIYISSGHNEANVATYTTKPDVKSQGTQNPNDLKSKPEDVVFIPNDMPVLRNGGEYLEDSVQRNDFVNNIKLGGVLDSNVTSTTKEDILFITGKNKENLENSEKDKKRNKHEDSIAKDKSKGKKFDCSKLNCDNIIKSVCGGKLDGKQWRYRLFLNMCYFRKVNCAFRYPTNRYKIVAMEKCNHIGNHTIKRPEFQPLVMPMDDIEITRRFSSRRSLNADINGQPCSHSCPVACTERYEPQCAVSSTGHRRTFLNHCKLDYNSCLYKVVWYTRPLSECVGGKKADIQQNKGFIAWMRKVGIVDNRGRLTLPKSSQIH